MKCCRVRRTRKEPLRGSRFRRFRGEGGAIGHALVGVRVLKIDGAFAPRVLKFDSGCAAEGYGSALWGTSINAAFGGIQSFL